MRQQSRVFYSTVILALIVMVVGCTGKFGLRQRSANLAAGEGISFSAIGSTTMTVQWGAASSGSSSLDYKLVQTESADQLQDASAVDALGASAIAMNWSASTFQHVVTGLNPGTTYHFTVLVRNAKGSILMLEPKSQITLAAVPQNLTITAWVQENKVSFGDATSATSYNIYFKNSAGVSKSDTKISVEKAPYTHTGLDTAQNYFYAVAAVNAAGESELSSEVSAKPYAAWAGTKQFGFAAVSTNAQGISVDGSGNVYVCGNTAGGIFGETLKGTQDAFIVKYNVSGTRQWTKLIGIAGATTSANGCGTDSAGNLYVGGVTNGNISGSGVIGSDYYAAKFTTNGDVQWITQVGANPGSVVGRDVAVDASGNTFVCGNSSAAVVDGVARTGTNDSVLVKFDRLGVRNWTKLSGVGANSTNCRGAYSDGTYVYATGSTTGNLDGEIKTGSTDLFLLRYDMAGNKLWTRLLGVGAATTNGQGVTMDPSGSIIAAGFSNGGLDGNALIGTMDAIVTKYDNTGVRKWTKQFGVGGATASATRVAADSSGNFYLSGSTGGAFDGIPLTGTQDSLAVKLSNDGTKLWSKLKGATGVTANSATLYADSLGGVFWAGLTQGGIDGNTQTGTNDAFVVKYNASGVQQ